MSAVDGNTATPTIINTTAPAVTGDAMPKRERRQILPMGNLRALDPYKFVCNACGKVHATTYPDRDGSGWDESCMLNAVLCIANKRRSAPRWVAVDQPTEGTHYARVEPE